MAIVILHMVLIGILRASPKSPRRLSGLASRRLGGGCELRFHARKTHVNLFL